MSKLTSFALAIGVLGGSAAALADAELRGNISNYTSYFTERERVRHNRYELNLEQSTKLSPSLSTKFSGRLRYDAALDPKMGAYRHIAPHVRDDELYEVEARQIYFDYLHDSFVLKIGLQQLDWVESLSPRTSDVLVPLDMRHAGVGNSQDIIEPMFAATLNHQVPFGSLEWILVPQAKTHRLPQAENGYGYFASTGLNGDNVELTRERIPATVTHAEFGMRYLMRFDSLEFSLLGYRGHQRSPSLEVEHVSRGSINYAVTETFPQINTFGAALVYAGDASVARLIYYLEPKRGPTIFQSNSVVTEYQSSLNRFIPRLVDNKRQFEERQKLGLGFDYVFSDHLKIYSEHFITKRRFFRESGTAGVSSAFPDEPAHSVSSTIRLTNESFESWLLSADMTIIGPRACRSFNPQIMYTYDQYRMSLGAHIYKSDDDRSSFSMLDGSDQIYLQLEWYLPTVASR